jgi:hypothetical protein
MANIYTVFVQDTHEAAIVRWCALADPLRAKFPRLAVLAFAGFAEAHAVQIHGNPLERLDAEIKRRPRLGSGVRFRVRGRRPWNALIAL